MEKEQKKLSTGVVVLIIILVVALLTVSTILAYKILNEKEANKPLTEVNNEQKEVEESKTEDKEENKVPEKEDEEYNDTEEIKESQEEVDMGELSKKHNEFVNTCEKIHFTVSEIEENEDGYTISAHILADEGRKVTKEDYEKLKNGGSINFRGKELVFGFENEFSETHKKMMLKEKDSEEVREQIFFEIEYDEEKDEYVSGLMGGTAKKGDIWSLRDYKTNDITKINVSKDVKTISPFEWLEYDESTRKIEVKNYMGKEVKQDKETTRKFMEEFESFDTVNLYGECVAYIIDGNVVAIMCNDGTSAP